MKIKICIALISVLSFCSWTMRQNDEIRKAEWLIGTWENKTSRGSIYESWVKISETEFSGRSYILNEKDTVVFEDIRLAQEEGYLFYIPTVKNQNEGLPVRFRLKTISETGMVFENMEHDFPQRISYTKINTDSLVAQISGNKNGKERTQTFPMKRKR